MFMDTEIRIQNYRINFLSYYFVITAVYTTTQDFIGVGLLEVSIKINIKLMPCSN